MVNLQTAFGTRYMYSGLKGYLEKFLKTLPDGETVDLAGVMFGPIAFDAIDEAMPRLHFTNSASTKIDGILKGRYTAAGSKKAPNVKVPEIKSYQDIVDFVKGLPPSKDVYKFEVDTARTATFALIALILARPELKLDVSINMPAIVRCLPILDCPKFSHNYYIDVTDAAYIYPSPKGQATTPVPALFCSPRQPIDLENPDESNPFYPVILSIKNSFQDEDYEYLPDVIQRLF